MNWIPAAFMIVTALRLTGLTLLAALWAHTVEAGCSRTITAAFSSPIAQKVYGALPERTLPSLPEAIAAASGCRIELVDLPTIRAWRNFNEGQLDIVMVSVRTEERDRIGDFVLGGSSPWALVVNHASEHPPRGLDDFAGNHQLRLGVARGAAYPELADRIVDQLRSSGQIDESADFEMALTKLANGRDAAVLMIADAFIAIRAATGEGRFDSVSLPALGSAEIGTYLNRQTIAAQDRKALMDGLREVQQSGLTARLLNARVPQLTLAVPASP